MRGYRSVDSKGVIRPSTPFFGSSEDYEDYPDLQHPRLAGGGTLQVIDWKTQPWDPLPLAFCMNIKTKGLQNLHFVGY